jgi:hypothetical protein
MPCGARWGNRHVVRGGAALEEAAGLAVVAPRRPAEAEAGSEQENLRPRGRGAGEWTFGVRNLRKRRLLLKEMKEKEQKQKKSIKQQKPNATQSTGNIFCE